MKTKIIKPNKPKKEKLKTYTVINNEDGNDSFEITAKNYVGALENALKELGWWVGI